MPRPQFTLRTLLVAMLVVAAFFAGVAVGLQRVRRLESEVERYRALSEQNQQEAVRADQLARGLQMILHAQTPHASHNDPNCTR